MTMLGGKLFLMKPENRTYSNPLKYPFPFSFVSFFLVHSYEEHHLMYLSTRH